MPDPNGTAVVMEFANVFMLEQHLYSLSSELNSQFFEVVPVEFHIHSFAPNATDAPITKKMQIETENQRQNRLQKARDYKKKMISNETETDREIRLQKNNALQKRKRAEQSPIERQKRVDKVKENMRIKRQKNQQVTVLSQEDYLNEFDSVKYGKLHEQTWAQTFTSKFFRSIEFSIFQCTVCHEAWPLKSKPRSPDTFICSRCSRDKKIQKKVFNRKFYDPFSYPS